MDERHLQHADECQPLHAGVLAVDTTNNLLHVFATSPESNGTIYEKTSPLSSLSFAVSGLGTPFIRDNSPNDLNNATTTKQTVNATTGLLVLAGHETLNQYWFNVEVLRASAERPADREPGLEVDAARRRDHDQHGRHGRE